MRHVSVSALIIGNEVLTAKVEEANGAHLVRRFRARGIRLQSMHLVPDEVDCIVEALQLARRRAAFVVTSGGVGPTHDDVTVRSVSLALGRRVVTLPRLAELLRRAWGPSTEPPVEAMRMAEGPEGSELVESADARFPVLHCDGVFLLPGVPELFRTQLEAVLPRLPGAPLALRTLYLRSRESDIANALDAAARDMPLVAFGSYPTFDAALDHLVKLTIEHLDPVQVEAAAARLRSALPSGAIVREG
jgi:molybdenum cofactor synthesis domain-containing protein